MKIAPLFLLSLCCSLSAAAGHHGCDAPTSATKEEEVQKPSLRMGITYEIHDVGSRDVAQRAQEEWQAQIAITGKLKDGTVFLNRTEKDKLLTLHPGFNNYEEPLAIKLFPELTLIGVGGKMTLHVPASAGFREYARGPVPAGSDLIFDIELVSVCDLDAEEKLQQAREDAWFQDLLQTNPDLIATPSGICYQMVSPGAERKAARTDVCDIKLTASLTNQTTILKDEPVRLYRNFYNSDHAHVIKHISELALIGEGGKLRLYIPFNMGFRHYAKEGIPAYSTLVYDVELCKTYDEAEQKKDWDAYLPKFYCIYEEYPMLLRAPQSRGNATCSWAFACTNTTSIILGKQLIDKRLTPPSIRTPIVRKQQVVGYEQPGPESIDGLLSAQMLISLMQTEGHPSYGSKQIGKVLEKMRDQHLISTKLAPYQSPESPDSIAPAAETYTSPAATNARTPPGGYSKRISLEEAYELHPDGICDFLFYDGAAVAAIKNWDSPEFLAHRSGVVKVPNREDTTDEKSEYLFVSVVGWGEDEDGLYLLLEDSEESIYYYDGKGPFSIENFSRNLTKVSYKDKYFFDYYFLYGNPRILEADGKKREPSYDLDVYKDRYQDGFLPWPYLKN